MQVIRKGTLLRNNSRKFQAEEEDYEKTGFDRGHLNPNSYHCGDSRRATFTLTNAVPQEPCFNQQTWKKLEDETKKIMRKFCAFAGAKPFFVTGTIPHRRRIPNMEYDHFEGQPQRHSDSYNRVSVPSHMWTAVCCDSTHAVNKEDSEEGFSFGYIGENKEDGAAEVLSVSQLEATISSASTKDNYERMIQIFGGNDKCRENSKRSQDFLSQVQRVILMRAIKVLNKVSMMGVKTLPPKKRPREGEGTTDEILEKVQKVSNLGEQVVFDLSLRVRAPQNNLQEFNTFRRSLKSSSDSTVILTDFGIIEQPFDIIKQSHVLGRSYGSFKKNQKSLFQNRLKLFPKLQEDKAVDVPGVKVDSYSLVAKLSKVNMTYRGDWCKPDHGCDYHGLSYVWCYTDVSWDYCCINDCDSTDLEKITPTCHVGGGYIYECSMRSSVITINGGRCRKNHECGLHNKKYFWCYTDFNNNWDYCCRPSHRCNKYGSDNKWCYTRLQSSTIKPWWQYCNY